jgi:hypothetical protein
MMKVEYVAPNVTVHEVVENKIAYLNNKGTNFLVFEGFREAMAYVGGDETIQILAEFDSEEELDRCLKEMEVVFVGFDAVLMKKKN